MDSMRLLKVLTLCTSVALWCWSLSLPAILFRLSSNSGGFIRGLETETYSGAGMLFASMLGPCFLNFAGVANPLLIAGLVLLFRNNVRKARIFLGVAALLTLQTFQLRFIEFPFDEAGVRNGLLLHPLAGWYVWAASIVLPLGVAVYLFRMSLRKVNPAQ